MTDTHTPADWSPAPTGRRMSALGVTLGWASVLVAVAAVPCAVVDLATGGDDWVDFGLVGAVAGGLGVGVVRVVRAPRRITGADIFAVVVVAWLVLVAWSTALYLATRTFDRLDDALFESVAGFTTTSATVLRSPEVAPAGVLLWRAATQWIGGLAALLLVVIVVPFSIGGRELATANRPTGADTLATSLPVGIRRVVSLYVALTLVVTAAYALAGLGPIDTVAHALSTVSTGGFSTRSGSLGAFDSSAVEWVAGLGMVVAGTSVLVVWRLVRGSIGSALTSIELRSYLGIVGLATVLLWSWTRSDGTTFRDAFVTAASAASTTGFVAVDWQPWVPGAHALLLGVVGIGAMAGSAGGGFHVMRIVIMVKLARRELLRELHPHLVAVVKVDEVAVRESTVRHMVGHLALAVALVAGAATLVAAFGASLMTAVSASVSALSTAGPIIAEDVSAFAGATALDAPARAVLMPVMLAGRLSIYPLLVGLAVVADRVRRR